MYQAIEIRTVIKAVGALGVLIFLFLLWYAPPGDSVFDWMKHVSAAAGGTAGIIAAFGNRWVFPYIWKLGPVQSFTFPYVAGEWVGTISSNWPVLKAMTEGFTSAHAVQPIEELDIEKLGTEKKPIKVTIEGDLFSVVMRMETLDKYSASRTVMMQPQRRSALTRPTLVYIYQNETPVPVYSDASSHFGAAILEVGPDGLSLEGTYWTARNWTKGLNTAGRIELKRPD
jgi:hypothetical protein